jgi:hypothetical protein
MKAFGIKTKKSFAPDICPKMLFQKRAVRIKFDI